MPYSTVSLPVPLESRHASRLEEQLISSNIEPSRSAEWLARAAIVGVAGALAWYTWGHWGDFQVDCGREIYVPAALLKGKLLYRDVWYCYGPLAPYLQAFLFLTFGVHLNVLFCFGLTLTVGSALLVFEIGRRFHLPVFVSAAPPLFFLAEAFHPFIFNFVFPYSYAASLGSFLGLCCLYFVLRHASEGRPTHLGIAAVFAGLTGLSKQEFGLACLVLLAFDVAASYRIDRSLRKTLQSLLVCFAGLTPAILCYAWLIWKVSAKGIFIDNWMSSPGTYFMRTFGKHVMTEQGFRFVPSELSETIGFCGLTFLLWFAAAAASAAVIKRLRLSSPLSIWVVVLAIAAPLAVLSQSNWASRLLVAPLVRFFRRPLILVESFGTIRGVVSQLIVPKGIFLIAVFFLGLATWNLLRKQNIGAALPEGALGTYAVAVSVRQMMGNSSYTAVFFNIPLFLIFVILLARVARRASGSLATRQRNSLINCMLGAETVLVFVLMFPDPQLLPEALTTDLGRFYTRPDVALLFPQIISFMRTETSNGKDILILPEAPMLYAFAGMQAPSRWFELTPGLLPPEHEQEFISEIKRSRVKFVLISNRAATEYGVAPFGIGYNQAVYHWIQENYVKVSQFGPLANAGAESYVVLVLQKKNASMSGEQ